jgi:hypothetical protein
MAKSIIIIGEQESQVYPQVATHKGMATAQEYSKCMTSLEDCARHGSARVIP